MNIVKIIAVIIGTLIGAGFASGKEIYIFFSQYGVYGMFGAVAASILTGVIIYSTIIIAKKYKINNNNQFIENISNNENVTIILENIINIFLLVLFLIMCSGLVSFFKQRFEIPFIITATLNAFVTYILLSKKTEGIIKLNSVVVPIMIAIIIIVSIKNFSITNIINENYAMKSHNLTKAIIAPILYTSYNSITLIPIIISVHGKVRNNKTNKIISLTSGIIIFLLIISVYQILISSKVNISNIELPVVEILDGYNEIEKNIYSFAIVTAIISSTISAGYGLLENIENKKKYKATALTICILQIAVVYIGFGNLVTMLYPIFGVLGIVEIIYVLKKAKSIAKE